MVRADAVNVARILIHARKPRGYCTPSLYEATFFSFFLFPLKSVLTSRFPLEDRDAVIASQSPPLPRSCEAAPRSFTTARRACRPGASDLLVLVLGSSETRDLRGLWFGALLYTIGEVLG